LRSRLRSRRTCGSDVVVSLGMSPGAVRACRHRINGRFEGPRPPVRRADGVHRSAAPALAATVHLDAGNDGDGNAACRLLAIHPMVDVWDGAWDGGISAGVGGSPLRGGKLAGM